MVLLVSAHHAAAAAGRGAAATARHTGEPPARDQKNLLHRSLIDTENSHCRNYRLFQSNIEIHVYLTSQLKNITTVNWFGSHKILIWTCAVNFYTISLWYKKNLIIYTSTKLKEKKYVIKLWIFLSVGRIILHTHLLAYIDQLSCGHLDTPTSRGALITVADLIDGEIRDRQRAEQQAEMMSLIAAKWLRWSNGGRLLVVQLKISSSLISVLPILLYR